MKKLLFTTNIDCPLRLTKAACGLECLRGKYCHFSVDLTSHVMEIHAENLHPAEIIRVMARRGIICRISY